MGADLLRTIEDIERQRPGLFGERGAYAQVFSLYTSASAGGVLFGPLVGSVAQGGKNWILFVFVLGAICASASIPLVSLQHV